MDEGGVDAPVIHPPGWDPNSTALALQAVKEGLSRPLRAIMSAHDIIFSEWQLRGLMFITGVEG